MDIQGTFRSRQKESSFDESKPGSISPDSKPHNRPLYTQPVTDGQKDMMFWIVVALSQVVGFIFVGLLAYWCQLYGGFAWASNSKLQFNFHPLLMILGLVFFYGEAILVYRVFSFLPKWILKWIHAALHLSAIVASSVGLAAVFENHRRNYMRDLYSLHSWVGLATFAFFCVQFVASFMTFLIPGMPPRVRAKMMPFHTFFGIGILLMAVASALMGITEKLAWTDFYNSSGKESAKANVGNSIGVLIVVFTFLVVFLATHSNYKRKPLPSEIVPSVN